MFTDNDDSLLASEEVMDWVGSEDWADVSSEVARETEDSVLT